MFAASWLYSQALLAVRAPRCEMSSSAGLNARGWAMSPAIQPALNATKATRPQSPAARRALALRTGNFCAVLPIVVTRRAFSPAGRCEDEALNRRCALGCLLCRVVADGTAVVPDLGFADLRRANALATRRVSQLLL